MSTYFGILTKIGEAKEANAKALGVPLRLAELEVGDGGGAVPDPNREQSALIGSKRRAPVNRVFVDSANPNFLVVEQVIPEDAGGWWIRELGLRDGDGDLVAVANCPPTYKPLLAEGSGRTQVIRMVLMVTSAASFVLKVDPAVVLATRGYVDEQVATRLAKTDTAAAATKLATARSIGLSGAVSAEARAFDGTDNLTLVVNGMDVSKASAGVLPAKHGGTGVGLPDALKYLRGNAAGGYDQVDADQVLQHLGALNSLALASLWANNIQVTAGGGYMEFPHGYFLVWGRSRETQSNTPVIFPRAFQEQLLFLITGDHYPNGTAGNNIGAIFVASRNLQGFAWVNAGDGAANHTTEIDYLAFGK